MIVCDGPVRLGVGVTVRIGISGHVAWDTVGDKLSSCCYFVSVCFALIRICKKQPAAKTKRHQTNTKHHIHNVRLHDYESLVGHGVG